MEIIHFNCFISQSVSWSWHFADRCMYDVICFVWTVWCNIHMFWFTMLYYSYLYSY